MPTMHTIRSSGLKSMNIISSPAMTSLPIILLIAELAVVLILSAGIQKRPVGVTRIFSFICGCSCPGTAAGTKTG